LVNGNVGYGLGDIGRLSHMKMAGLVTTQKSYEKINGKMMHHSWVEFTEKGVALAKSHGVEVEGSRYTPKPVVEEVKEEKPKAEAKPKRERKPKAEKKVAEVLTEETPAVVAEAS
jgi:hypothetical protein